MEIKHFSHKHRLTLYDDHKRKKNDHLEHRQCEVCLMFISSLDFYICKRCDYYICRSCGELTRQMRHPFHQEHPLTLLLPKSDTHDSESSDDGQPDYRYSNACNACSERCGDFVFKCSECEFYLHVNCAMLMPTTTNNNEEEKQQMITHPHPLISCHMKKEGVNFQCCVCEQPIGKDTICVCLHCRTFFDKSCAQLPQQITHDFHPHHTLTLKASLTKTPFKKPFCYSCSECEFSLDISCASLMPKPITKNYDDQLPYFTHQHVLILCDININTIGNFNFLCHACHLFINQGTIYVCLECDLFLHKSCAELPPEIKHPFHPPHPLVLHNSKYGTCGACRRHRGGAKYQCATCNFAMDTECASLRPTVKFKLHQHPLAFFIKKEKIKFIQCSVHALCSGHVLSFPYFRCVPCDFNIDLFSVPTLPHTFKHSSHRHSLTLNYSPIKDHSDDDDDSEYYCDLCEDRRELQRPTYYCEDCHYVAELSCVFTEILPLLEREWLDEEIVTFQKELNALTTKLKTQVKKLNEVNERRARHIGDYQIGVMEVGIKNASTDDKKALSVIMLQADVDSLKTKLETATKKLDEFKERRAQHIDYQIGLAEVETRNASVKTFSSVVSDHPVIAKPEEEIVMLQAEVNALTAELKTLTTKLNKPKDRHPRHVGDNQIGSIHLVDIMTLLDDSNEVVEEDGSVESTEKEDEDEDKDEESDGTFSSLAEIDEEIEVITAKLEALKKKRDEEIKALTAMLKVLKDKRSRVSSVMLKSPNAGYGCMIRKF